MCVDDYLDLPSLTNIQCEGHCWCIHSCIGNVILESGNDFIHPLSIDIPNLTFDSINYGNYSFFSTAQITTTSMIEITEFDFLLIS